MNGTGKGIVSSSVMVSRQRTDKYDGKQI